MERIDEITINDMLEKVFTSSTIKKKRKDIVAYYEQQFPIGLFDNQEGVSYTDIQKRVDEVLKQDRQSPDPFLSYSNSYYKKAKRKSSSMDPTTMPDSNYMGKGGECLVMGELLFNGYNVNNMIVDEGIDLVACKDNVFYYIQVKTKSVAQNNRVYFQIKKERFASFVGTQIRYILVSRYSIKNEERTMFFIFTNNDIERLMFHGAIPQPANETQALSIKIEYDPRTAKAFVCDGKVREDVSFNMNNFKL